jgi:hypothetical protein
VSFKLSTGGRERCASLVADKGCAAQLVVERVKTRADVN